MLDAEELYYKLQRTIEDQGLTLNDEADDFLEQACNAVFNPESVQLPEEKDPFWHWQTYSTEGNALMQRGFERLEKSLREGKLTYHTIKDAANDMLDACEEVLPGQGYHDTEPRGELIDRLNVVLDDCGYKQIGWL